MERAIRLLGRFLTWVDMVIAVDSTSQLQEKIKEVLPALPGIAEFSDVLAPVWPKRTIAQQPCNCCFCLSC